MIEFKNLTLKNYFSLKRMYGKSKEFNQLNDGLADNFQKSNFLSFLMSNQIIKLIKVNKKYIGYVWYENIYEDIYLIRDLYIPNKSFKYFDSLNINNMHFLYESYTSSKCNEILSKLNFFQKDVSDLMVLSVDKINIAESKDAEEYEVFQRDHHENIRCELQNSIFDSNSRIPLTLDDVYFDEEQDYYIENACIFIKENDTYVGMGQIINLNNKLTVVNFGIRKEFRNKGYGKKLMNRILYSCTDIGKAFDKREVYIRVSRENSIAYALYEDLGFKYVDSIISWEF